MRKTGVFLLAISCQLTAIAQPVRSIVGRGKEIDPYKYTVVKNANFSKAAVSSAHPLASMVGAAMMKQGGNAFDAAIATQLALAVVYPGAGNLGGAVFYWHEKPTAN
jgi:gamma-glutamyltranspeptidase/glutathione hydrolase